MSRIAQPFDDIRDLISRLPERDATGDGRTTDRSDLGRLGEIGAFVAAWQGKPVATAARALVAIFASTHGVTQRAIEGDLLASVRQRLEAFAAGTTPTNAICAAAGLGFKAFDLAIDHPSGDISREAAMDERGCVATMAFGMESIAGGTDLVAIGEAGTGAELAAAAMLAALYGDAPVSWLDPGRSGPQAARLVTASLLRHGSAGGDPLAVLASLGGRDIAAMAGAILAARLERVPVILDGFASTTAAAMLHALAPEAIAHCLAGHSSTHIHHAALLARLGLEPLLPGLGIAAGEGVGAALAAGFVRTAVAVRRDGIRSDSAPAALH